MGEASDWLARGCCAAPFRLACTGTFSTGTQIGWYLKERKEAASFWDLRENLFADNVTDADVVKAFDDKLATFKEELDPVDTLFKIATKGSWNDRDISRLAELSVDEYYKMFKENKPAKLQRLIQAALGFDRMGGASEAMREISSRAKEALKRIGTESRLNARRVKKYGIVVEEPAGQAE